MKAPEANISTKAAAWVENHTWMSLLLVVLCLAFAVNLYFWGPGSDGGSGLGGTGLYGGESGLGGTGKSPDSGPSFKLGANDQDTNTDLEKDSQGNVEILADISTPRPIAPDEPFTGFDVNKLRLNRDSALPRVANLQATSVDALVSVVDLSSVPAILAELPKDLRENSLVTSQDILESLMLAEADMDLAVAESEKASTRSRVAIPVRPERPDRLNVPTRIAPVSRASIPAPPPVRPMRTLSSLLNR
jgi:hypothetical protein